MKIRQRLTLLFTLITATILLVFASVIYLSARENRENEFYSVLKKEALTKANLFFNAKVETKTLQDIYRNNRTTLNEVEVAIYDQHFSLLYHDAVDIDYVKETPAMIQEISEKGEKRFYQSDWQVIGLRYAFENQVYIVTATAIDQYGYNKLASLLRNIILVFVISILFIYLAGRFFSNRAFDPVKEMTEKVKVISATNLDLRLGNQGSKDELAELANTFNEMLSRLENSFDAQKEFVSNISHELRTPLAAIITELDLSLSKNRNPEEYKLAIQNALSDARKLVRLSNNLLDLAKASYDPAEISFKPIRIDEILLDARRQVQQANPEYKIDIFFADEFENEQQMTVNGNEYLLKVAFANLMENACKFSPDATCRVSISTHEVKAEKNEPTTNSTLGQLAVRFVDKGIGIADEDLAHIFTPFFRGENKSFADGNGIGLSLTHKIVHLHHGSILLTSKKDQGTEILVALQAIC